MGAITKFKAISLGALTDINTAITAAKDRAQEWASKAEDSIVDDGKYSSLHYASKAESFVDNGQTTIKGVRNITASETLVLADAGKLIEAEHADTKIDVTIPTGVFADYTTIAVERTGAAAVEILAAVDVTINGGKTIETQYDVVTVLNKGGNIWTCIGGVV